MTKNNLTKKKISKKINNKIGFSLLFSSKLVDDLIKIICLNINNQKMSLKNIGTFKIINKKERVGRNPKTKQIFTINSRKSISFTASKKLLKLINKYE